MSPDPATIALVNTAIGALPSIIALIKDRHGPKAPTDEEVLAALGSAVESSLAKDAAWKAANPLPPTDSGG